MCAVLLHLASAVADGKRLVIHFGDEDGGVAESKDYDMHRTVFAVSRYLQNEIEKQMQAAAEEELKQLQIKLECPLLVFDITADLLDKKYLNVEVRAGEVVGVLELAMLLDIGDKEAELYMGLAQAAIYDRYFREEIKICSCVPSMQLFAFYLLREYATMYGAHAKVSGHRVALVSESKHHQEQMLSDVVETVDEMSISAHAMASIVATDKYALYALKSFVRFMGIRRLCVDYCTLDTAAIKCIGKMRSLTGLSMKGNNYSRNLKYLRNMSRLTELDVSGCKLMHTGTPRLKMVSVRIMRELAQKPRVLGIVSMASKRAQKTVTDHSRLEPVPCTSLSAIGSLKNLKVLRMEDCGLEPGCLVHIRGLQHIEELDVSMNRLCRDDVMVIGGMEALSSLNIGYCKIEPGCMEYLQDLELAKLCVAGNELGQYDMMVIGNVASLAELVVRDCTWEADSFGHLQYLASLRKLDVSLNALSEADVAAIGKMVRLEELSMHACSLAPGSLVHVSNLQGLTYLDVSGNVLDSGSMFAIGTMRSLRTLHMCNCDVEREGLVHLRNLKHLEYIYIDECADAELQEHRDIVHYLRSEGVHVCTNRLQKQKAAAE